MVALGDGEEHKCEWLEKDGFEFLDVSVLWYRRMDVFCIVKLVEREVTFKYFDLLSRSLVPVAICVASSLSRLYDKTL